MSCGKLDKGLGKPSSAIKYYNQALEMYVRRRGVTRSARITDGEDTPIYTIVKGLIADVDFAYNGKSQKVVH